MNLNNSFCANSDNSFQNASQGRPSFDSLSRNHKKGELAALGSTASSIQFQQKSHGLDDSIELDNKKLLNQVEIAQEKAQASPGQITAEREEFVPEDISEPRNLFDETLKFGQNSSFSPSSFFNKGLSGEEVEDVVVDHSDKLFGRVGGIGDDEEMDKMLGVDPDLNSFNYDGIREFESPVVDRAALRGLKEEAVQEEDRVLVALKEEEMVKMEEETSEQAEDLLVKQEEVLKAHKAALKQMVTSDQEVVEDCEEEYLEEIVYQIHEAEGQYQTEKSYELYSKPPEEKKTKKGKKKRRNKRDLDRVEKVNQVIEVRQIVEIDPERAINELRDVELLKSKFWAFLLRLGLPTAQLSSIIVDNWDLLQTKSEKDRIEKIIKISSLIEKHQENPTLNSMELRRELGALQKNVCLRDYQPDYQILPFGRKNGLLTRILLKGTSAYAKYSSEGRPHQIFCDKYIGRRTTGISGKAGVTMLRSNGVKMCLCKALKDNQFSGKVLLVVYTDQYDDMRPNITPMGFKVDSGLKRSQRSDLASTQRDSRRSGSGSTRGGENGSENCHFLNFVDSSSPENSERFKLIDGPFEGLMSPPEYDSPQRCPRMTPSPPSTKNLARRRKVSLDSMEDFRGFSEGIYEDGEVDGASLGRRSEPALSVTFDFDHDFQQDFPDLDLNYQRSKHLKL